ncbi:retrotransposon protein [Cucumis melo var. makuwa]|uniref:Retrotransposon protein n=1 Tax=Cucumis melo var. makuwa TaxID=1194695 RepID=A0A5A7TKJ1_CUCMM|nr:retrotransposon protein [Cucumis melo var. makuwa]TYK22910.1 retrotransposon protein [Cucumis melo var. makuwa]
MLPTFLVVIELPVPDTLPTSAESSRSNSRSVGIVRGDDVCWLHAVFRAKTVGGPGGDVTYIKVNVPATDRLHSECIRGKLPQTYWAWATRKRISFMSSLVRKDRRQTRGLYVMPCHEKIDYKCQRDIIICAIRVIKTRRGFWPRIEASGTILQKWRGGGNAPKNAKDYFNMKHSLARNVIERPFDVFKGHWAILRGKSYYPLQVQCRSILACCLLHDLINREMTY